MKSIIWAVTAVLLCSIFLPLAAGGELLPVDPRIESGTFANGVRWHYRQHDVPPGKMNLMIHVDTGSLNETEPQRGLSHFMEHMMFNGSKHFPPGELIAYFESIGMEFGADINAFTSFDQTAYMVFTPNTEIEQIDKALLVLSDYAFGALLLEEEIENERGVIMAELRSGQSAQERIRDELWPRLFDGSRLAQRMIIGTEEVIQTAPRSEFLNYYQTWYHPEKVSVFGVGDLEAEKVVPLMEKHFASHVTEVAPGKARGPEITPFSKQRAFVVADPDITDGTVEIYNVRQGRAPTTTKELYRLDLVEGMANWIMNRRFEERINKGEATYQSAGAGVFGFFKDTMMINASADGEAKDWERMLEELIIEVNRAREHGFTDHELGLAKKDLLASAERSVLTDSSRNAQGILMSINRSINTGEPVLSAEQDLALTQELLSGIAVEEVSRVMTEYFVPEAFAFVLTLPEKEGVVLPSTDDLLAAARAALARKTEAPAEATEAKSLLARLPEPGKVLSSEMDEDLNITSAWLENGTRVHHRFMDYKKDSVLCSISLAGGGIEETPDNIGITQAAALAFGQAATHRLSSSEINDLMIGKNITVRGAAGQDALTLMITGSPSDFEQGLQLAHALLTDGLIEESAFSNWQTGMALRLQQLESIPEFKAAMAMLAITSGNDLRLGMMTLEALESHTLERSQAWLERICREAPIEVAVVGEITLDQTLPLINKYVGSLAPRKKTCEHLEACRNIKAGEGPFEKCVSVETITPKGMAMYGFRGCDRKDFQERRALSLASQTLSSRVIKRIREDAGLVYSISADLQIMEAFNDHSIFMTGAPCDPAKVDEVVKEASAIFQTFAEEGPTPEELEIAKKQVLNNLDTQRIEPRYWWSLLMNLDQQGVELDVYKEVEKKYQTLTAEDVQRTFKKYCQAERIFQVTAVPVVAPAEEAEAAGTPQ